MTFQGAADQIYTWRRQAVGKAEKARIYSDDVSYKCEVERAWAFSQCWNLLEQVCKDSGIIWSKTAMQLEDEEWDCCWHAMTGE